MPVLRSRGSAAIISRTKEWVGRRLDSEVELNAPNECECSRAYTKTERFSIVLEFRYHPGTAITSLMACSPRKRSEFLSDDFNASMFCKILRLFITYHDERRA